MHGQKEIRNKQNASSFLGKLFLLSRCNQCEIIFWRDFHRDKFICLVFVKVQDVLDLWELISPAGPRVTVILLSTRMSNKQTSPTKARGTWEVLSSGFSLAAKNVHLTPSSEFGMKTKESKCTDVQSTGPIFCPKHHKMYLEHVCSQQIYHGQQQHHTPPNEIFVVFWLSQGGLWIMSFASTCPKLEIFPKLCNPLQQEKKKVTRK